MTDQDKQSVRAEKTAVFNNLIKQGAYLIEAEPEQLTGDFLRAMVDKFNDLIISDF